MNQLEAIRYLVANGAGHSEWAEAAMWSAVCKVMQSETTSKADLDAMIASAESE